MSVVAAEAQASRYSERPFASFFMGGFECSTHIRADQMRLDLLSSTQHDRFAAEDYALASSHGLRTFRDGVRWHLVEPRPGFYDWSSWLPMLRAAHAADVQVIWDLCHYGLPQHQDIWSADFVTGFARYAAAAAQLLKAESDSTPFYCPINEISYWAWAGGEVGRMNPGACGRGSELKQQLVRAYLAAVDAIRDVDPSARFMIAEPLIHVAGNPDIPGDLEGAQRYRVSQYEVHEMVCGRVNQDLGGQDHHLDLIGCNFYPDNQWYLYGNTIPLGHHAYRSLAEMLLETYARYNRPLLISETGAENSARPAWLHYVSSEVMGAVRSGVPVEGICLYPILDYQGWDNERVCNVGLLSKAGAAGRRRTCAPMLAELQRQQSLFAR